MSWMRAGFPVNLVVTLFAFGVSGSALSQTKGAESCVVDAMPHTCTGIVQSLSMQGDGTANLELVTNLSTPSACFVAPAAAGGPGRGNLGAEVALLLYSWANQKPITIASYRDGSESCQRLLHIETDCADRNADPARTCPAMPDIRRPSTTYKANPERLDITVKALKAWSGTDTAMGSCKVPASDHTQWCFGLISSLAEDPDGNWNIELALDKATPNLPNCFQIPSQVAPEIRDATTAKLEIALAAWTHQPTPVPVLVLGGEPTRAGSNCRHLNQIAIDTPPPAMRAPDPVK